MSRPTLATRLRTLVLALLFIAGNFGLATADGLLNHRGPPDATATASHIEGNRGCGVHAESCVLESLVAQHQDAILPSVAAHPVHVAEVWGTLPSPALVLPAPVDTRSHPSRAPPALLAL